MNYELTTLFALGSVYLLALFGIAYVTDKGLIPDRIKNHPIVYVLSIGVFASVWAYYGSVGNALRDGYGYLAPFLGISLAFLLSPLLLKPLLDLTRTYQLSSLADLMAFRYRSPWAGTITTLVTLVGITPLIALQIEAVADTADILSQDASQSAVAVVFCVLITLFAILFGTSRRAGRDHYDGLIMAIAFESLSKLVAFLIVGGFAIGAGFGGLDGLDRWLTENQAYQDILTSTDYFSGFHVLTLMFFAAAVAMPHMFYVTFNGRVTQRMLGYASWGVPLYFLLISLPVLPILWAGVHSDTAIPVEYLPIAIGVEYGRPAISLLAYLGGLSAASGLIIVLTLALSNMCLNHLILPIHQPSANQDIYRWLRLRRRLLITALIWLGFLFYWVPESPAGIDVIGTVAFTAGLNFLPGTVGILYWPQGNRKGYLAGVLAGFFIWLLFLMLPIVFEQGNLTLDSLNWREVGALSLIANAILFVAVSLLSHTSDEERSSADICALDTIRRRKRSGLVAKSPEDFMMSLAKPLGERTANREVTQALEDLNLTKDDRRPYAMRLLRGRLEANLSGLLGPSIAREIIDGYLPYSHVSEHGSSDLNTIENRIESYRSNLSGMAADLDSLRRYHRQILLDLPLGVLSLSAENEIIMWNHSLEKLTTIQNSDALGSNLSDLPEPWLSLLSEFVEADSDHSYKKSFELGGQKKTVDLHKAAIDESGEAELAREGLIVLIEDITETEMLEAGLTHSERLASIGRLAAGVAHEIGNPITGIACLAQTIRDEYDVSELQSLASQIIEQTDRTSKILQSLVSFAHAGSRSANQEKRLFAVSEVFEEAQTLISLDRKNKDYRIELQCDPQASITGDAQHLLQVLVNLINNARDASPHNGLIKLTGALHGGYVEVAVSDEGVGIPEAIRDRIFDPFFTTKEAGEGTGLGLSLVYSMVEEMDGEIDIISPVDRNSSSGTRVVLRFPPAAPPTRHQSS